MSSNSATTSILVKFLSVETRTVKYEYQGKSHTTNSFQTLLERARKAGITVLYTQPVKRYMAKQSQLRRSYDAKQHEEMCAREDTVQLATERSLEARSEQSLQANVACDNSNWTFLQGIGPETVLKLYREQVSRNFRTSVRMSLAVRCLKASAQPRR